MLANVVAAVVFVATFAALCRAYTLIRNIRAAMWESEDMAARKAMRLEGITAPYVGRRK